MAASLMHAIKRDVVPFCVGVGVDVCTRDDDTHARDIMLREQVASLANRSNDPAHLLSSVVEMTCRRLGFLAGNALMREGVEGEIELHGCGAAFASDPDAGAEFVTVSNRFSTWACATLPGRLLLDPVPSSLTMLQTRANFSRHREAQALGAQTMVAIPILVDGDVVGAFEFFLDQASAPSTQMLDMLFQMSSEVAHVFRRAARETQLRRDVVRDPITGLPNRTMFEAQLAEAFGAARTAERAGPSLMVIEFDGFKRVRDVMGYQVSDGLLAELSQRIHCLVEEFGAADRLLLHYAHAITVARIGGDDFAISIDGPDRENLTNEIAEAVHHNLRALDFNRAATVRITASIGIAHDDGSYAFADELLRDADFAMYQAQTRGVEHSVVFDQQMRADNQATLRIVDELQYAITNHQFILHYQPIFALAARRIVGVEALLRWRRSEGELVMPDAFIDIAENHGLIAKIGNQALRQACRAICEIDRAAPLENPPFISVNVSTHQLLQADFLDEVRDILDDTGIAPNRLVLELTESAAILDLDHTALLLAELRSWGVLVGLDDFGTGYSSLSHLQTLPFDGIKIDKGFVMNQNAAAANWTIVTAILQMAKALKIRVIAEGIETEFQLEQLRALGCVLGQGYYFSRPVDQAAIIALLQAE